MQVNTKDQEIKTESVVKDMELADWGRKEQDLAEVEMPGLMETRKEYGPTQPLKGAKITGSLHMTIQTGVLIETLEALGAEIRWCSCNIFSTQDHAASGIAARKTAKVFAWKEEKLEEQWWCTYQALSWPGCDGPDTIVDDGGDATMMVMKGAECEEEYEKSQKLPDPESTTNPEMKCVLNIIKDTLKIDPKKWTKMLNHIKGVSEETTTGVLKLHQLNKENKLPFTAFNVNDCVTKSKFDNVYGCRHSLPDGIMRATDVMLAGKKVLIIGFGDVGKGCAESMKNQGSVVYVSEVDPICALQACMQGYTVVTKEQVVSQVDIFVTCTGNYEILMADDMSKMKHNAIVCNIGHFDNEIDMEGLSKVSGITKRNIKPQVDQWIWPDGHATIVLAEGRLVNLGCATGHPSFVMSNSFTCQTLAQIELWTEKDSGKYKKALQLLPKTLDEKVAFLHLKSLGATLTKLSDKQANYIGVRKEGPFKNDAYRY